MSQPEKKSTDLDGLPRDGGTPATPAPGPKLGNKHPPRGVPALAVVVVVVVVVVVLSVSSVGVEAPWLFPVPIPIVLPGAPVSIPIAQASVYFTVIRRTSPPLRIPARGTLILGPDEPVLIAVDITVGQLPFPREVVCHFSALAGSVPKKNIGCGTSYVAPDQLGPDVFSVLITDQETGGEIVRSVNVLIEEQ